MKFKGKALAATAGLSLISSSLIVAPSPTAVAATLTATGTDAAICNQEVSIASGVTAQRLSDGDCVITFTQPTTLINWTAPSNLYTIKYLVIGGGGGGATGYDNGGGGGGGAGLMLVGSLNVTPGVAYEINIGAGGAGGADARANNPGAAGSATTFSTLTATGGQGGYGSRTAPGGARVGGAAQSGSVTSGRGGNGGSGGGGGGGGGGVFGAGGTGVVGGSGGTGGAGLVSDITGTSVTYAVGGSGGSAGSATAGAVVASNTGRGGNAGGGANSSSSGGSNGGSGIVVIRYSTTPVAFNSLGIQGGAARATYRSNTALESNLQASGRVTFFADGKRIPRCIDVATVGSAGNYVATCNWLPARKGSVRISVMAKPTAAGLTTTTSTFISVVNRTTRR